MDILTNKQAYNIMFSLLDKYYENNPSDDLGSLLGDISPLIFGESDSADPAAFEDFQEILHSLNDEQVITPEVALKAMNLFLRKYEDEFGYELKDVLSKLTIDKLLEILTELESNKK